MSQKVVWIILVCLINILLPYSIVAAEESEHQVCIQVLTCAVNSAGEMGVFSTPCAARDAGYEPVDYELCSQPFKSPVHCRMKKRPVCARSPLGERQTYFNRCFAESEGAKKIRKGACRDQIPLK